MPIRAAHVVRLVALAVVCWFWAAGRAEAQLGALVSPGRLAKAHASLEGAGKCQSCHSAGRKVTAEKCLACHAPIARRIQEKRGVHKGVTECITCHVDHAGVDGELRPFDTTKFNHLAVTGFPLDGKHAPLATQCASCHKTRSFVTNTPTCGSCHTDVHKGKFGMNCATCHQTSAAFKNAKMAFDHRATPFPLVGAHRTVACAQCHTTSAFKIARFACADCHRTPHPASVSKTCTSCHTNDNWRTKDFNHNQTAFPLVGAHATVRCESCHKQPAAKVKPPSATCASCHSDPHKGVFKADCKSCHSERTFKGAPFDHQAGTASHFALLDGHSNLACVACHRNAAAAPALPAATKTIDFRGRTPACKGCHVDVHRSEFTGTCESCHTVRGFAVTTFTHPVAPAFHSGQHAAVACAKCHRNRPVIPGGPAVAGGATLPPLASLIATMHTTPMPRFKATPVTCASCHADPHFGQFVKGCETCHSVAGVKFAPDLFSHDRTRFSLTPDHRNVTCAQCHKPQTAVFPAGRGTATRLAGLDTACRSCHRDGRGGKGGK